jgi:Flp pilus assembly protein TadD
VLLASKGDLPEAAWHLELALQSRPDNVTARCNYAIALAQLNRPDEAERQLQLALQTDPNFAEAHLDLGILLADKGDLDGAAAHLKKAAEGSNVAIRQKAVQMLKEIGK